MRDLSLHLLDIIQNSITAQAKKIVITIAADQDKDKLTISIRDNGVGMDRDMLDRIRDPFVTSRTTRKVGLGIPMLEASARLASGTLDIQSEKGVGTIITATFQTTHIDRLPIGDVADTITTAILTDPAVALDLVLESACGTFTFQTEEVWEKLNGVPITDFAVMDWIREYVNEGIKNIFGGVLNEVHSGSGGN